LPDQTDDTFSAERGRFFAVDRRAWHYVSELGNINPAIAYLVIAKGTGRDNRTTSTSTHAVSTYTRIARSRAKAAIAALIDAGAVRRMESGSRPRYYITPAHNIPGVVPEPGSTLSDDDDWFHETLMDRVRKGTPIAKTDLAKAGTLVEEGWLVEDKGKFSLGPGPPPEWIWLPNELVTGAQGETPPIERVRRSGDVMLLRLLVDLYDMQSLAEDGGVRRTVLRQNFARTEIGRCGKFIIFGFRPDDTRTVWWNDTTRCHRRDLTKKKKADGENEARDFWRRLDRLLDFGLVEWVPHLIDNDSAESEIIHPYGTGNSESVVDQLGHLAHQAALASLTIAQRDRATEYGFHLAPVLAADFRDAQMIGVLVTTYRAKSAATAAWIAKNAEMGETYIPVYERLIATSVERATKAA
jgi:hypothetical protein